MTDGIFHELFMVIFHGLLKEFTVRKHHKKVVDLPIRSAFPIGKIQHHLQQIQVIRHFVLGCLKMTYNSELLFLGKVMN